MTETPKRRDIWWWYWAVTLVFIIAAVVGWSTGYTVVILISAVQLGNSIMKNASLSSFPVQVRLVYLGVTLFGFLQGPRLYVFLLLFVGTAMVVFAGRCGIVLILKKMPWNEGREVRLN